MRMAKSLMPGFLKLHLFVRWYVCVCVSVCACVCVCICVSAPEGINNQWHGMV